MRIHPQIFSIILAIILGRYVTRLFLIKKSKNVPNLSYNQSNDLVASQNFISSIRALFDQELYSASHWQGHRKLSSGKPSKRITMFASAKNGFSLPCESSLETNYCYKLEFDDDVKSYRTQGLRFEIGEYLYTPDFFILTSLDTVKLVEIKPECDLLHPEVAYKLGIFKEFFNSQQIPFEIVTELLTDRAPYLKNYELIYPAASLPFTPNDRSLALKHIKELQHPTIKEVKDCLIGNKLHPKLFEHLVCHKSLSVDFGSDINLHTLVGVNND